MRNITPVITILLSFFLISNTFKSASPSLETSFTYDETKGPWEQPNPIFRWPLPEVSGEAHINVRMVLVNSPKSILVSEEFLKTAQNFIQDTYNPYGIYINFLDNKDFDLESSEMILDDWKDNLPSHEDEITIYVLTDSYSEIERKDFYASNGIVADKVILPLSEALEFKVYATKSLSHALGLLPTYFENTELGVAAEDANNCGFAGDFVCDTPFDHFGLKNEVKRKNCRYKGKFGEPDVKNIMSNSWTECMDQITYEQANKIKYILSVIPSLQHKLSKSSSIPLNIGMVDKNTINQVSLK